MKTAKRAMQRKHDFEVWEVMNDQISGSDIVSGELLLFFFPIAILVLQEFFFGI